MYRVFALIFNVMAFLGIGSIFQSGVTLTMQVPNEVIAGSEFEVKVNIQKGDLESFSRFQQDLPAGLTATSSQTSNADFSFEDKRVRLIWLRLPQQDEFSVVYRIKVDERLKGSFSIDGKFSYIDQNERKSVSAVSQPITILPSPDIDPSLIVDIKDFEEKVIPYIPPASAGSEVACIRQTPIAEPGNGEYIVNLLVNKKSKQKFAKIEESIPAGYKAINIDPKDAIFTFKDNIAKFLWMNLPSEPYFLVSYKLVSQGQLKVAAPDIHGKFSYLEGEKTISMAIRQTDRDLASVTPAEIGNLIASLSAPALAQAEVKKETEQNKKAEEQGKTIKNEKKEKKETQIATKKQTKVLKKKLPYILEPEEGVYFRVQLAAGHKPVNVRRYFAKYNLDKEVREEIHEGWQKYSVGSFKEYKEARDYRVHIWNTTVIDDAFVSAYNNGMRITVQEALMINNQAWYR
jgi:hypothetical protein